MNRFRTRSALMALGLTVATVACSDPFRQTCDPGPCTTPTPTADGQLVIEVTCAGVACGAAGDLTAQFECGSGSVVGAPIAGVTLSSGMTYTLGQSPVPGGSYCVRTFLDRNADMVLNSADAIASSGADVTVVVPSAGTGHLSVVLDAFSP